MNHNNILYVIANTNMNTVDFVASCLNSRYKEGFNKIVLFESKEAERFEFEQVEIYRKYFGDFEKIAVILNSDSSIPSNKLYDVFAMQGKK